MPTCRDADADNPCPQDYPEFMAWADARTLDNELNRCAKCWLNDPEYKALCDTSDLFRFCVRWINLRELGFSKDAKKLSVKEEQAVLFVNGTLEGARAKRMRTPKKGHDE